MSWVVSVLQRTGEQRAEKLGCVEWAIALVVLRNHYPGCGIPRPRNNFSLGRGEISWILVQDGRQSKPLDESAGFRVRKSRTQSLRPTLRTSAIVGPLARGLSL